MSKDERDRATGNYRTEPDEGLWFSISPSVLPPDDSGADWVDLHRHQEGGMVVLGRFPGVAAAIAWAGQRQGVDPAAWRPDDDSA